MAKVKALVKKITDALSAIKEVRAIILYGSAARREFTSRSDIDLFIIVSRNVNAKIENAVIELENEIHLSIQPTVRRESQIKKTDSGLLQNIFQEGRILYLKNSLQFPAAELLEQKPFMIYTFDISHLKQNEKAAFNRVLYGYKDKKYFYEGLLQKLGGSKLSAGCILIPYGAKGRIENYFEKRNVKPLALKIWK